MAEGEQLPVDDRLRLDAILAAGQGDADEAREALRVAEEIAEAAKNNAPRDKK